MTLLGLLSGLLLKLFEGLLLISLSFFTRTGLLLTLLVGLLLTCLPFSSLPGLSLLLFVKFFTWRLPLAGLLPPFHLGLELGLLL
jgi:CHASE2 domain-containing sensor protein